MRILTGMFSLLEIKRTEGSHFNKENIPVRISNGLEPLIYSN
jgi:hypothetical protein